MSNTTGVLYETLENTYFVPTELRQWYCHPRQYLFFYLFLPTIYVDPIDFKDVLIHVQAMLQVQILFWFITIRKYLILYMQQI